jgi:hypothetical protein
MKTIDPGHHFKLDSLDGEIHQTLQFVKRVGENYPGNESPSYPGTTSQEVLRALIARTLYVDKQQPDPRNPIAISGLRMALRLWEERAAEKRGEHKRFLAYVDGVWDHGPEYEHIEDFPTCTTCGHIVCGKHTG